MGALYCKDFDFSRKNPYRGVGPCTVKTLIFHENNPYRGVVPGGGDFGFVRKIPYRGVVPGGEDFDFSRQIPYRAVGPCSVKTLVFHEKIPIGVLDPVL